MIADLERLRAGLDHAHKVYTTANDRLGSAYAVDAVCNFLLAAGMEPRLQAPLQSLIGDMADDLTRDGRKPLLESLQWAQAARAVDILKREGMALPTAADEVSKATGRAIGKKQLIEFRRNVRKRRARQEAIDAYFAADKHAAAALAHLKPEDRIKETLHAIRQAVTPGKKG